MYLVKNMWFTFKIYYCAGNNIIVITSVLPAVGAGEGPHTLEGDLGK